MYPILLRSGGFTLYSYGVMAAVAMLAAGLAVRRLAPRHGLSADAALELTVAAIAGGLAGARLYWAAEHWQQVRADLLHELVGGAGLTWYGGLLGGAAAVLLVARHRRLPLGGVANVLAPGVALGYAVARIGCQLAGDGTYGRASDLPWAMAFPRGAVPTTVPVQPTAVYETLIMLAAFAVLYGMARRAQPGWHVFAWFLVLSGAERLAVEFARINPPWLLGLTAPQWFALAGVFVGMALIWAPRVRREPGRAARARSS
ncbi:MAG: prolipoprotein diacylglyceryl transferase family protein [Thermoleophilia bacterium]